VLPGHATPVLVPAGVGAAAREQRAAALDAWLTARVEELAGAGGVDLAAGGVCLVAVGGLGRRECAPHSDLDLVLLHDGQRDVDEVASRLWYRIWDARLALDHSVRTLDGALAVAAADVKVALGLLDARPVAGDRALVARLRQGIIAQWRSGARQSLPALRDLTLRRWQAHGELAFLLEGDVKEARGGLRDHAVLRGIGYAGVADAARPAERGAHRFLLDVRDGLHVVRGRRVDRLLAQDRDEVARLLDLAGGTELARRLCDAARTVAHAGEDAWRAVDRWRTAPRGYRTPVRRPLARDVVAQDGEAVLARTAVSPRPDPSLSLRVAAAAARSGLPIARATLEWLAAFCPPLPRPWPAPAREALLSLLGCGAALVSTWEACDRYGLVGGWLPEWTRVRSLPQHNPVHRFTVDRHLIETARHVAGYARDVDRPDLLVLCAFLHDIGKGLPGDHSTAGSEVAAGIAARIGLPPADVAAARTAVRHHLLLPETATRRDLADPVTVSSVAAAVGEVPMLRLLHALARADAAATGPAAWSAWKDRLVGELVERTAAALDTGRVPPLPRAAPLPRPARLPDVLVDGERVVVTATDRRGLLAAVAGCLSLHRLDVIAADASTVDGLGRVECAVQPRFGSEPDGQALAVDLRRAASGELPVAERLTARDRSAGRQRPARAAPRVVWQPATDAVVLELRAADSPGLLYRVAHALAQAGAQVRAARISTLGGEVVDAFYLSGRWDDLAERAAVGAAVLAAATG
jgi:[protein-PII] uridylyltransferase